MCSYSLEGRQTQTQASRGKLSPLMNTSFTIQTDSRLKEIPAFNIVEILE
jgi:hypothetical protein